MADPESSARPPERERAPPPARGAWLAQTRLTKTGSAIPLRRDCRGALEPALSIAEGDGRKSFAAPC